MDNKYFFTSYAVWPYEKIQDELSYDVQDFKHQSHDTLLSLFSRTKGPGSMRIASIPMENQIIQLHNGN